MVSVAMLRAACTSVALVAGVHMLLLARIPRAEAHGSLVWPLPRNAVDNADPRCGPVHLFRV